MESTEDSSNNNNSRNPKQPEADFGPSTSGNQTKQYKGRLKGKAKRVRKKVPVIGADRRHTNWGPVLLLEIRTPMIRTSITVNLINIPEYSCEINLRLNDDVCVDNVRALFDTGCPLNLLKVNLLPPQVSFLHDEPMLKLRGVKGSSRTFEMDELKSIIFCVKRQVKNPSHEEIKRAIEDPSLITFKRRPGEGLKPMFDRFRVGEINLALENDMVSSKRPNDSESLIQKRKRSVSRERSSSVGGRRRSRSTTPDRKQLASYGMLIPMMPWSYPLYPRHPSLMPPPMRSSLVYYSRTQAPSAATEAPTNLCVRNKDSNEAI